MRELKSAIKNLVGITLWKEHYLQYKCYHPDFIIVITCINLIIDSFRIVENTILEPSFRRKPDLLISGKPGSFYA